MAYLIDSDEARHIAEVPDEIGFCYGKAIPEDESQAWVNATALKGLRSLGRDPRIIAEEPTLPTFHGLEGLGFDLSEALAEVQQGIEAGEPRVGR